MVELQRGVVQVRDLSKRYGPVEAVRGVSFEIAPGEIVGLLGVNGAGKTTIIECLLGLRRPDGGSFCIGDLDAFARPAEARRVIGAQLQVASLQDQITPREALTLIAAFHERPAPPQELLEQFALTDKADAAFASLSGGQKQRLLLALAFVHRPFLLLLDEPTAGLDPAARRELHQLITARRDQGEAVLFTTHYLDEAAQLCDRVALLDAGRIIACDSPRALVARSSVQPRIRVRSAQPIELAGLPAEATVVGTATNPDGATTIVQTRDIGATAAALVQRLERTGNSLLDLQIERATLEDVFLELTGQRWEPSAAEERA